LLGIVCRCKIERRISVQGFGVRRIAPQIGDAVHHKAFPDGGCSLLVHPVGACGSFTDDDLGIVHGIDIGLVPESIATRGRRVFISRLHPTPAGKIHHPLIEAVVFEVRGGKIATHATFYSVFKQQIGVGLRAVVGVFIQFGQVFHARLQTQQ